MSAAWFGTSRSSITVRGRATVMFDDDWSAVEYHELVARRRYWAPARPECDIVATNGESTVLMSIIGHRAIASLDNATFEVLPSTAVRTLGELVVVRQSGGAHAEFAGRVLAARDVRLVLALAAPPHEASLDVSTIVAAHLKDAVVRSAHRVFPRPDVHVIGTVGPYWTSRLEDPDSPWGAGGAPW